MSRFFIFLNVLFAFSAFFLPEIVLSQSVNLGIPPVLNYTKQDFKAGTQVWDIAQDKFGYMWFGNNGGLLEFDGVHWRVHPLPNKTIVRSVKTAKNGCVYVGGQDEFGFFAPQPNGTLAYQSLKDSLPASAQRFGDVWNIFVREEGVFFRSPHQVFRFHDNKLTTLFPTGSTILFMGEWNGQLVIQPDDFQLLIFKDNELRALQKPMDFRWGGISGMLQFSPDTMLVTTIKNGIFYFNGSQFLPWPTQDDAFFKSNTIYCAKMLKDGKIALGTSLNGLVVLDRQRRIYYHLNKKSGLQNNTILSLFASEKGGLWLGLDNGIDFVDIHSPITTLFPDGELQGTGYTAKVFGGKIYFGTNTGLYATDWKPYYPPTDRLRFSKVAHSEGQVWSLNEVDGNLLMGHHEGAFEVKGLDAVKITSLQGVWRFVPMSPNYAIAGHYNGLAAFRKTPKGWAFESALNGLAESSRLLAKDTNEDIWMAHPYRGIFKIRTKEPSLDITVDYYGKAQGLPSDQGNHLFQLNDNIVFSSETGVFTFNWAQNKFLPDARFSSIFGPKTQIRFLKQDPQGNIWYVTDRETGMLLVENHALGKHVSKVPIPELNEKLTAGFQFVLPIDPQNAFVATEKGFVHFNPKAYFQKDSVLQLVLQEVRLKTGADSVLFGGHPNPLLGNPPEAALDAQQNSLTFAFSALNFSENELVLYSHYLEGADKKWSPWANETNISFNNLAPGSYRFMVKARNKYGAESQAKIFAFVIRPPWYASRLAYFLYLMGFLAVIVGIIYRQSREFDKEKKGLVHLHNQQARYSEEAINRLQNEKLEAEVQHKNQELASATLHIVQKSEILNTIKDGLEKLKSGAVDKPKLEKEIGHLIKVLEQDARTDADWELFSQRFDQVHSNFLKRLGEQHTHLSPNDYKLCAYLRLNLSSKEIASLMNISLRGVESSRYRLRKRLGLDTDENLTEFLMRL